MAELWNDWGDGEHAVTVEQPAAGGQPAGPASDSTGNADLDATLADLKNAERGNADQAAAAETQPDAEYAQENGVPFEVDDAQRTSCIENLQSAWGDAFEPTMQSVKSIVEQAPDDIRNFILGGRFEDGRAIANDPGVIKWLASLAPSGARAGSQSPEGSNGLDAEIASIEAKIGTREYMRNETMQARLRHLYAQRGR